MSSRDIRRAKKKKKSTETNTEVEKKRKNKPILYLFSVVLLVIIVVTFVGGPVAGNVAQGERPIFGEYAGREIEFRYGNYFAQPTQLLSEQVRSGGQANNMINEAYQVWRGAFERSVVHEGILYQADKAGLTISDDLIDRRLTEYGPYVENGEFSEERYRNTPNSEKLTTRKLFRENLKEEQYREDLFDNTKIHQGELEFIMSMAENERSFRYVSYSFDDYPEEEVIAFGRTNADLFRRIKLSKITINTSREEAEAVLNQLEENPGRFEDLARTQSSDIYAETGGEMDWLHYYELEREFPTEDSLDEVFSLTPGELSGIIPDEDETLWRIYRCESPAVAPDFDAEETVETAREYMVRFEAGIIEDYLVEEARSFIAEARDTGFIDASISTGLQVEGTEYFPLNYGNSYFFKPVRPLNPDSDALSTAPYSEQFFLETFSLEEGEISDPVVLDRNVLVMEPANIRNTPEEELVQLENYYSFIEREIKEEDMSNHFLTSEKLEDNFDPVFTRYFIQNQTEG